MIFSAAGVGAGISLGLPLLSIVLAARGVSGSMIGLNTAMAGIARSSSFPSSHPLRRRSARIGSCSCRCSSPASLSTASISSTNFWLWFPLRLVFHGGLSTAFVMSEFWINSLSPPGRRGLIMGIYATVLSLGFTVGPTVLAVVGSHGYLPFAIGSVILIAAALPVLLALHEAPDLESGPNKSVAAFIFGAPAAILAALTFGAIEAAAWRSCRSMASVSA